jgi:hypothetical protein
MQHVVNIERTRSTFGPFDTKELAEEFLAKRGFKQFSDYWIRDSSDFQEVVLADVRPLRAPTPPPS